MFLSWLKQMLKDSHVVSTIFPEYSCASDARRFANELIS